MTDRIPDTDTMCATAQTGFRPVSYIPGMSTEPGSGYVYEPFAETGAYNAVDRTTIGTWIESDARNRVHRGVPPERRTEPSVCPAEPAFGRRSGNQEL
jgi:hypothetical protein